MGFFILSCGRDPEMCHSELTPEALEITPYIKDQKIKWQDQDGNILEGNLSSINKNRYILSEPGTECSMSDNAEIETIIDFKAFKFNIKQRSTVDNNRITYCFEHVINGNIINVFDLNDIPLNAFRDIIYREQSYSDVVVAHARSGYEDAPVILIFSKNNGIEYIQYANNKWYKRKE